jgi:hypothetical protein
VSLLFLSLLLIAALFIINSQNDIGISLPEGGLLILSFCITGAISLIIFLAGQKKEKKSQGFFTLVSVTLKFLMELIIALIWFLIAKKTSFSSVLLFFVLYLSFTTFSIIIILNTLKNK